MNPLIEFRHVSYTYDSEGEGLEGAPRPAVQDISLAIARGAFVAVLGHNGSGKSTLAKLCNAILIPQAGTVLVDGISTGDEARVFDIRKKVGMVFQNPDNQIVATLVEDDVAFGLENLGVPPADMRRRVDEALRDVGMYEFRLHEPHRLSGGQKQRVAIAGVIAMRTDCVVLDESTAMLDPRGRREVLETARRLNREQGITVVLITHFMEEAVAADRVLVMHEGGILLDGTPRDVFAQDEKIRAAGLDLPQAAELANGLRRAGLPLPPGVLTEEACVEAILALKKSR
jgi:energy-coupling factor transport system ATP-binding protein